MWNHCLILLAVNFAVQSFAIDKPCQPGDESCMADLNIEGRSMLHRDVHAHQTHAQEEELWNRRRKLQGSRKKWPVKVTVNVLKGNDFPNRDEMRIIGGKGSDPFVTVEWTNGRGNPVFKTTTKSDTANPVWNEKIVFRDVEEGRPDGKGRPNSDGEPVASGDFLRIEVMDEDWTAHDKIGAGQIMMEKILEEAYGKHWKTKLDIECYDYHTMGMEKTGTLELDFIAEPQ